MNKTLVSILDTKGPCLLELSERTFSKENVEEFFDCPYFYKVNFIDCSFNECHFLGGNFTFCSFENCKFTNTLMRKSDITDCKFKDCQFIESILSPRVSFFRTSFKNCEFLSVNLSDMFLSDCEFTKINCNKIKFSSTSLKNPKINNIIWDNLEFDKDNPLRIYFKKTGELMPIEPTDESMLFEPTDDLILVEIKDSSISL